MPNRILKDSICVSDNLNELSPQEEVFWYRLLVQCDDYGRMDARPAILRAKCFPLKLDTVSDQTVATWLAALQRSALVELYTVDSKPYLQVATWTTHQQVRTSRSKYPEMPGANNGNHLISSDINGNQAISDAPLIQSNPNLNPNLNPNRESNLESNAPPAQDDDDPARRAVCNAYDACGLMITKTHLDLHLETIKRTGLQNWQIGFAAAIPVGKQNVPKYVARCAESAMLAAQAPPRNGNGNGGHGPPPKSNAVLAMEMLQAEEDAAEENAHGRN